MTDIPENKEHSVFDSALEYYYSVSNGLKLYDLQKKQIENRTKSSHLFLCVLKLYHMRSCLGKL